MKDSQRLIVFIALSGLILLSYNYFFMPKPGQNYSENIRPAQTEKQEKDIKKEIKNSSEDRAAINLKPVDSKITKKDARLYTVETDLVTADFSDIGAALNGYRLKKYSDTKKGDLESLELIPNKSSYTYMSLYSDSIDLTNTQWNLLQRSKTDDGVKLIFQKEIQKNVIIEKEYVLKDGTYVFDLNLRFINNTQNPFALQGLKLSWGPNIHFLPADVDKHKDGFVQYNRISYLDGDEHQKIDIKFNAKEDTTIIIPAKSRWITMKDLYFTSSFIMKELSDYKNYEAEIRTDGFAFMNVNLKDMILSPGTSEEIRMQSYTGPKEYKRLKKINMEKSVDLGWLRFLSVWMFYAMDFFHGLLNNYGLAIIFLTILIRGLLWVPSQKSFKHMKETQKKMSIIKPRMETLKKIYKEDPQKLNEETMKLYKEYKINPFGGCLPMLLQLPIFIAFYQTLMNMVELKGASFIWWMQDLSRPDSLYILPFIMGGSMFIQQKMSQAATPTVDAAQASQQKIFLYGLPVFLTFLSFNWPSGLLLYWSISNVLGIAQQYFVNKSKD